jgi:decaprenyl-phosphate phosphoribosyltransferase
MGSAELAASLPAVAGQQARSARTSAIALLRAARPKQWTKNLLVLAAPMTAGVLDDVGDLERIALAMAVFCMLSSATYLVNDVRDREQDRQHPVKCRRPIAAAVLKPRTALAAAGVLVIVALALAMALRWQLALVGACYLALTTTYSVWWRRVIGLDILAIAAGFVLRAAAGGAAVDVGLSRWFLLVTSCGAIFVVAGKRYAELREERTSVPSRHSLGRYSVTALQAILALAAAGAISAYVLWTTTRHQQGPWYELTIIPVVLWFWGYARLVARGAGETPEELILGDRPLLVVTLGWTLLFVSALYVGP